jgi:hypothetical protein
LGNAAQACERLRAVAPLADAALKSDDPDEREAGVRCRVYLARALVGVAEYREAIDLLAGFIDEVTPLGVEALAFHGLADSYLGNHDSARQAARARGWSAHARSGRAQPRPSRPLLPCGVRVGSGVTGI